MLIYVDYTSLEEFKPDASSLTAVLPYDCVNLRAEHPATQMFPIASLLVERLNSIIIIDPYPLGSNMFYGFKPDPQFAKAPSMDWIEAAEAYFMKVDLPGLKREEVKVEVEQALRMLQISGEPGGGKIGEDKNYILHRMERITGKFHRRFKLPENAKLDLIKASMGNGLLTVTVPKEEYLKVIEIFDDSLTDQNGTVLRVKSAAEKGKAVLEEEAKDIKCTEISGEKSRRLKTIKIE